MLEQGKTPLSLMVLGLATFAVFFPKIILLAILLGGFVIVCYRSPDFGIVAAILATLAGEFGRITLLGNSLLLLDLVAPIVILTWLTRKLIRREKLQLDGASGALLGFFALAILSLIAGAVVLDFGELKLAGLYLFRFLTLGSFFWLAREARSESSLSDWLLITGAILAGLGFYLLRIIPDFQAAGLADLGWDPHIGRLTSTWLDPNFAAGGFAFLLALLGGKFLHAKKFNKQVWLMTLGTTMLVALLLSYSRSGLVALGCSGLILGFFGNRKILVALVIFGLLGVAVSPRLAERVAELGKSVTALGSTSQQVLDPTAQLRFRSWQEGWRIWQTHPLLGVGYGTYKFHQNFSHETSNAATGSDASLLNIGATTGILGLGAFILFLVSLIKIAWGERKTAIGIGFLAGLGGLLVHSIFVNSLLFPPILLCLVISGGLVARKQSETPAKQF